MVGVAAGAAELGGGVTGAARRPVGGQIARAHGAGVIAAVHEKDAVSDRALTVAQRRVAHRGHKTDGTKGGGSDPSIDPQWRPPPGRRSNVSWAAVRRVCQGRKTLQTPWFSLQEIQRMLFKV